MVMDHDMKESGLTINEKVRVFNAASNLCLCNVVFGNVI